MVSLGFQHVWKTLLMKNEVDVPIAHFWITVWLHQSEA